MTWRSLSPVLAEGVMVALFAGIVLVAFAIAKAAADLDALL